MKIPQLKKQRSVKTYHGHELIDDFAWVDQPNIIEVLQKTRSTVTGSKKIY